MAREDVDIIVNYNDSRAWKRLEGNIRRLEGRGVNINTKKGELALGRITGKADEFTKSLEASNARVIAFGASVAVIEGLRRSFRRLVSTVIEVETRLTQINSIFQRTESGIRSFGNSLFTIAKDTGQAFSQVADTAQEFARQGLSVEKTLERTKNALILTRLTTLSVDDAVDGLTATLNGFQRQALTSAQVLNKLRAVETSFAVGSGDLIQALSRSASVAQDANLSFEELLGSITAIKQRTGLGGATIGQGLKTALTRINIPSRIEELQRLGVQFDESSGGLERLTAVAREFRRAQDLGENERATQIGIAVAGQFQISKISPLLQDLASDFSVVQEATKRATQATNEAIEANLQLNKTLEATRNRISENISSIFAAAGEQGGRDFFRTLLTDFNNFLEALQGNKIQTNDPIRNLLFSAVQLSNELGILSDLAQGFFNVLSGPGVIAAGAIIGNLIKNTLTQGGKSLLSLIGINKESQKRAQIQLTINALLQNANAAELQKFQTAKSVTEQQQVILSIMNRQLAAQKALELQGARVAETFRRQGVSLAQTGGAFSMTRSARSQVFGRTPNFAGGVPDAIKRERSAIRAGVGGASASAKPMVVKKFNFGSGKSGPAVINTDEILARSPRGDSVFNRNMVPNMALGTAVETAILRNLNSGKPLTVRQYQSLSSEIRNAGGLLRAQGKGVITPEMRAAIVRSGGIGQIPVALNPRYDQGVIGAEENLSRRERQISQNRRIIERSRGVGNTLGVSSMGFSPNLSQTQAQGLDDLSASLSRSEFFDQGKMVGGQALKDIYNNIVNAGVEDAKKRFNLSEADLKKDPRGRQALAEIKRNAAIQMRDQISLIRQNISNQALAGARERLQAARSGTFSQNIFKGNFARAFGYGLGRDTEMVSQGLGKRERAILQSELKSRRMERSQALNQRLFLGGFALSMGAPFVGSFLENRIGGERGEKVGRGASGFMQGAGTGLTLGAMTGMPKVAIAGAAIGGIIGLVGGMKDVDSESGKLAAEFEELRERLGDSRNSLNSYLQVQSQLNDLFSSGTFTGRQVSELQRQSRELLSKSGISSADRFALATTSDPFERVDIVNRITRDFNRQTNQAGLRAAFDNVLRGESGLSRAEEAERRIGLGRKRTRGSRSIISEFQETGFSEEGQKAILNLLEGGTDFDAVFQAAGDNIEEFQKSLRKDFNQSVKDGASELDALSQVLEKFGLDLESLNLNAESSSVRVQAVANDFFKFAEDSKLRDTVEGMRLDQVRVSLQAIDSRIGQRQIRSVQMRRAGTELDFMRADATSDLSFSGRRMQMEMLGEIGGTGISESLRNLERERLEEDIRRRERDFFAETSSNLFGEFENIIKSAGPDVFDDDIQRVFDQIANNGLTSITQLEEAKAALNKLSTDDNSIAQNLKELIDNASKQLAELNIQSDFQKAQLDQLQGFQRMQESISAVFRETGIQIGGRGDESLRDRGRRILEGETQQEKSRAQDIIGKEIQGLIQDIALSPDRLGSTEASQSIVEEFNRQSRVNQDEENFALRQIKILEGLRDSPVFSQRASTEQKAALEEGIRSQRELFDGVFSDENLGIVRPPKPQEIVGEGFSFVSEPPEFGLPRSPAVIAGEEKALARIAQIQREIDKREDGSFNVGGTTSLMDIPLTPFRSGLSEEDRRERERIEEQQRQGIPPASSPTSSFDQRREDAVRDAGIRGGSDENESALIRQALERMEQVMSEVSSERSQFIALLTKFINASDEEKSAIESEIRNNINLNLKVQSDGGSSEITREQADQFVEILKNSPFGQQLQNLIRLLNGKSALPPSANS